MYPKPDRSDYKPNFSRTAENDVLDLGWAEGTLSDGRPYRAECWAQDQITMLTLFVPFKGMEHYNDEMFQALLSKEGLIEFLGEPYVSAAPIQDVRGNEIWSINVVIGTEDGLCARDSIRLRRCEHEAT
jgi:hypothetical protein